MYQYSFNNVHLVLTLGGVPLPIVNVPDQAAIFTIARRAATRSDVMGARGEMNVATTVNFSGVLSFPLMQTAPENAVLSVYQNSQEREGSSNPLGTSTVHGTMVDLSNVGNVGALNGGYIPGPPQMVRGTGINFLMWQVVFQNVTLSHGANVPTSDTTATNYL